MKLQLGLLFQLFFQPVFGHAGPAPCSQEGPQLQPEPFPGSPPAGCFMQYSQLHTVLRAADASRKKKNNCEKQLFGESSSCNGASCGFSVSLFSWFSCWGEQGKNRLMALGSSSEEENNPLSKNPQGINSHAAPGELLRVRGVSAWFAAVWGQMLSEKGESGTFLGLVPGLDAARPWCRVWGGLGGGPIKKKILIHIKKKVILKIKE